MSSSNAAKKQRTHPPYELLYHPEIPGRGEFVRLPLEAAGVAYKDLTNEDIENYSQVQDQMGDGDADGNPPSYAPPMLRVPGAGLGGKALVISQTANIVTYLGRRLGLAPTGDTDEAEAQRLWIAQLTMTALDLTNEVHDSHHPISVDKNYEEQASEAATRAKDFRQNRIPKFLGHFESVRKWNRQTYTDSRFLVGDELTVADTTLWQVLAGMKFGFPKEMEVRMKKYPLLFGKDGFFDAVSENKRIKEYLESDRRLEFSNGMFRHYPELDRQ